MEGNTTLMQTWCPRLQIIQPFRSFSSGMPCPSCIFLQVRLGLGREMSCVPSYGLTMLPSPASAHQLPQRLKWYRWSMTPGSFFVLRLVLSQVIYAFHHVSTNPRSLYHACTEVATRCHSQPHRSTLPRICMHYRYGHLSRGYHAVCRYSNVYQILHQPTCVVG